ncbi:MAG: hypothetical protein ACOYJU_06630 [Anaerovoracaceae bacterium]
MNSISTPARDTVSAGVYLVIINLYLYFLPGMEYNVIEGTKMM